MCGFVVMVLVAGCGGTSTAPVAPQAQPAEASLNELGQLFQAFAQEKRRPPKDLADLASISPEMPAAEISLREGKIVVLWGGAYTTGPAGGAILAYEKGADTGGGLVLLQNGTVKSVSAAEFQAAPKPGK
jgi:hypothetical protein